jgi:hypothetical protein
MTDSEKLIELRVVTEADDDDSVLLSYLHAAGNMILNRMYPYKDDSFFEGLTIPKRHEERQIRIAAYLMNKRGAEGELQHIENGIHRNYKSADVPEEWLCDVYPQIGIPR